MATTRAAMTRAGVTMRAGGNDDGVAMTRAGDDDEGGYNIHI